MPCQTTSPFTESSIASKKDKRAHIPNQFVGKKIGGILTDGRLSIPSSIRKGKEVNIHTDKNNVVKCQVPMVRRNVITVRPGIWFLGFVHSEPINGLNH